MIASLFAVLLQSASAAPANLPRGVESAPAAWDGSFAEGLREVRRLVEGRAPDEAVRVAERLVAEHALARRADELAAQAGWRAYAGRALQRAGEALDLLGPPSEVRAEAQFARAVALRCAADAAAEGEERDLRREQAHLAFESARLLAGAGRLRRDATYGQGSLALAAAEELRARIPEVSGASAAAPAPTTTPPAGAAGTGAPPPPDPLPLARAAYQAARERFVERLRMDWRDPDTQADVELVQRRLRELEEIERQRQEAQEEQKDDQQKQQDGEPDPKQDPQKPDDPQQQDPDQDRRPEPDEPRPDEPKPDEPPKTEPDPKQPQDAPEMSKEEEQKLLERLQRIEEVQKELQEKLKRLRRVAVEKDW